MRNLVSPLIYGVEALVELHGGTLRVRRVPGRERGSEVVMLLPAEWNSLNGSAPQAAAADCPSGCDP